MPIEIGKKKVQLSENTRSKINSKIKSTKDAINGVRSSNPIGSDVFESRPDGISYTDPDQTVLEQSISEISPEEFKASVDEAVDKVSKQAVSNSDKADQVVNTPGAKLSSSDLQPTGEPGGQAADMNSKSDDGQDPETPANKARLKFIQSLLPENPTFRKIAFFGLVGTIVVLVFVVMYKLNDGARVRINTIQVSKIEGNSSTRLVTITYDKTQAYSKLAPPATGYTSTPMGPGTFKVCFADIIYVSQEAYLSGSRATGSGDNFKVTKSNQDDKVQLKVNKSKLISNLPNAGNTIGMSPAPDFYSDNSIEQGGTYTLDCSNMEAYMYIDTSFANHAASGIADTLSTLADIALNVAENLGDGLANVGQKTFCQLLPFFCDSTIWLVVLIGIVAMIIFVAVS